MLHQAGLLAQPHFRPSRLRSGSGGNGLASSEQVFTATGIAPEWNRTSLLMNLVGTIFNRNAKQRYGIGICLDDEDVHILWIPEKSMGNFPPSALFIIFNA